MEVMHLSVPDGSWGIVDHYRPDAEEAVRMWRVANLKEYPSAKGAPELEDGMILCPLASPPTLRFR